MQKNIDFRFLFVADARTQFSKATKYSTNGSRYVFTHDSLMLVSHQRFIYVIIPACLNFTLLVQASFFLANALNMHRITGLAVPQQWLNQIEPEVTIKLCTSLSLPDVVMFGLSHRVQCDCCDSMLCIMIWVL